MFFSEPRSNPGASYPGLHPVVSASYPGLNPDSCAPYSVLNPDPGAPYLGLNPDPGAPYPGLNHKIQDPGLDKIKSGPEKISSLPFVVCCTGKYISSISVAKVYALL